MPESINAIRRYNTCCRLALVQGLNPSFLVIGSGSISTMQILKDTLRRARADEGFLINLHPHPITSTGTYGRFVQIRAFTLRESFVQIPFTSLSLREALPVNGTLSRTKGKKICPTDPTLFLL